MARQGGGKSMGNKSMFSLRIIGCLKDDEVSCAYLLKDILQVLSSRNGLSYFVEEANIITETSVQPPLVLTHVPAPLPAPAPAPVPESKPAKKPFVMRRKAKGWTPERHKDAVDALKQFAGDTSTKIHKSLKIQRSTAVRLLRGSKLGRKSVYEVIAALTKRSAPDDLIRKFRIML